MSCEQCLDRLTELLEGELPPETEREVRAHLDECAQCAEALAELGALVKVLRGMPEVEPPAELRERLHAQSPAEATASVTFWRRSRSVVAAVAAAAAAMLMIWTGVTYLRPETGGAVMESSPRMVERYAQPEATVAEEAPDVTEALEADDAPAEAVTPESGETAASVEAIEPTRSSPRSSSPPRNARSGRGSVAPAPPAPAPVETPAPAPAVAELDDAAVADEGATSDVEGTVRSAARGGPPGPAGSPEARATGMTAEATRGTGGAPSRTLTLPPPVYLDAGAGTAMKMGEGTPFTVAVTPPHEPVTGRVVPATIRIETEADVARARVTVAGSDDLELIGLGADGVVFEGPLEAGQETVLSVRMMARSAGVQSLTMRVRSTDPVVDTQLDVGMGDFAEPVPAAECPVTFNFVGTPIRVAVGEIVRQSGMNVIVDPGCGNVTVTLRTDDPLPAAAALRLVVEAAGCTVTEHDGRAVVEALNGER